MNRDIVIRAAPFAAYLLFLAIEDLAAGMPGVDFDIRWLYAVKAGLVAAILLFLIRDYEELRRLPGNRLWLLAGAPAVGAVVFALWIHLDQGFLNLGDHPGFDPRSGADGTIDWRLDAVRLAGATLVVPVMEELFWRSFLMRWIDRQDFLSIAPAAVSLKAVLVASITFGFAHSLWLAGIIAGLVYAWLYRASGSLWPPILAHAVTNGLLGIWVLRTGSWQFW
ncbi:MAG: CAAX prenyl protease-related protein [Hydrogenophilaceae bacterium]|nr:CAAX prenyl protease-related protein [Hydrogenophilaceae bacterium]